MTPNGQNAPSRLRKLLQDWTDKTLKIQEKCNKVGALGKSEGLQPSLLGKLTRWMEQIAGLREKELDIISEIKHIEEKHHSLRKEKVLRHAAPSPKDALEDAPKEEEEKKNFWWWILIFLMFFSRSPARDNAPKNG